MFNELKKRLNSPDSFVSLILGLAVVLVVGTLIFNYISSRRQQTKSEQTTDEQRQGLPLTHTVAKGDTLWSLAQTYYKNGYNWVDIQKKNNLPNPNSIEVGQTLSIPEVTPIATSGGQIASGEATQLKPKVSSYTVVHGDTLWSIALASYGTGYKWVDIARANNLANPNLIHAGNVLTLP